MSFCMCPFLHRCPISTQRRPSSTQLCIQLAVRSVDDVPLMSRLNTFEVTWLLPPFLWCCIPVGQLHLVLWQLHHVSTTFSGLQKHLLGAESRYKGTDAMYHNVKMLRSIRIPFHPRSAWERLLKCGVVLEHSGQSLEGSIDFYDFPWCSMRY